jgi:ABC-type Fe3+-hydroxamate transport system substrate-binding protein
MKTGSGHSCIGITIIVLLAITVLFTGCTSPTDQKIPSSTGSPGVTAGQGTPAPASTSVAANTDVSASLPYGVTLSVPADWKRENVLSGGVRDYGTTTVNIANFYSPYSIPGDQSSYVVLSVDVDQSPGTDFEKYFNNATIAVQKTYDVLTEVEVHSYTLMISGYKSYELDFQTEQVKGTYIFTSTENGMYIFSFRVQNKRQPVQVFQNNIVDIYKSIRINPPTVVVTPHR